MSLLPSPKGASLNNRRWGGRRATNLRNTSAQRSVPEGGEYRVNYRRSKRKCEIESSPKAEFITRNLKWRCKITFLWLIQQYLFLGKLKQIIRRKEDKVAFLLRTMADCKQSLLPNVAKSSESQQKPHSLRWRIYCCLAAGKSQRPPSKSLNQGLVYINQTLNYINQTLNYINQGLVYSLQAM